MLPSAASPAPDGQGASSLNRAQQVALGRRTTNLDVTIQASSLAHQMNPIAKDVRMALGSALPMEMDPAEKFCGFARLFRAT